MSAAILGLLALGLLAPLMLGSDDNSDNDNDTDIDPDVPTPPDPLDITSLPSNTFEGTSGNDTIDLDPVSSGFFSVYLDGGDGDDLLLLSDEDALSDPDTNDATWFASTIHGGDGSDTIDVSGDHLVLNGGDGDDSIGGDEIGYSTLLGGEGDDWIDVGTSPINAPTDVYGGPGDDTLIGNETTNLMGGYGDDDLNITGPGVRGADGAVGSAEGGVGEDTISYEGPAISTMGDGLSPLDLTGGADADIFEISTSEGGDYDAGVRLPDGSLRVSVVNITDFEAGLDQLEIELDTQDPGYDITSARIDGTDLVVRYEHASEPIRDVVVHTNSAELSWDDITFVGDHIPPVLQAVA